MQVMSQDLIQEIPHPTAGTVRLPGKEPAFPHWSLSR